MDGADNRDDPDIPPKLGRYEVIGKLGEGGMSTVHLARSNTGRYVALKVVRRGAMGTIDRQFRARFEREIQTVNRVCAGFTAPVLEFDATGACPWAAMELVAAPSLSVLIGESGVPMSVPGVRWVAAGIAEALQSIHEAGIAHRDLNPSNVLVGIDAVRLIDFGISWSLDSTRITSVQEVVGTLPYMAPEQLSNRAAVDRRSDIHALGGVIIYAATGHAPYLGNKDEVAHGLLYGSPDLRGLPVELHELVFSCMHRDPDSRPTVPWILDSLSPHLADGAGAGSFFAAGMIAYVMSHRNRIHSLSARVPRTRVDKAPVFDRDSQICSEDVHGGGPACAANQMGKAEDDWLRYTLVERAAEDYKSQSMGSSEP